ncbi:MAG TPA: hypothetical protein VGM88_14190 [Kofleriaceae bacterium]
MLLKLGVVGAIGLGGAALWAAPDDGISPSSKSSMSVEVNPGANLSPAQMGVQAHAMQDKMRVDAGHILHLREQARKEKDVIKLNCVNDKLVQVKPAMNIADSAVAELSGGADAAGSFREVAQASENVRRLREESDQCVGESLTSTETSTSFTGPDIPPPYANPWGTNPVEPPGYASPYN